MAVLATLATLAGCSSPLSPSAQRGSPHFGIVTQFWGADVDRWTADLGAGWIRLDANWFDIEPGRGVFEWSGVDSAVYGAKASGLRVFATLAYTPSWAGPCRACMPVDTGDWRRFVSAVLTHFRGTGIVFGIWNEPNLASFLEDSPDGAEYVRLFQEANAARQAVDPGAVFGAPETSHHGFPSYFSSVMEQLTPSMRPDDIVSVHYYADAPFTVTDYMSAVALAAGRRVVWLTETGAGTCDPQRRATFLNDVLTAYQRLGRTWWANVFPYVLYNNGQSCDALVNPDGSYTPAFLTYRSFISTHP